MDKRIHRSTRVGIDLLIVSSLALPAAAQAQTGPGYAGAGAYPPAQYSQPGTQGYPIPGPYGAGSTRGPGPYGMGPGQGPESYGMGGPRGRPGMMGGPQGGPGQMGAPGMMGGPQGGPGQMGGPGMMGGPRGGPGQMGAPGMMGGPRGGAAEMGGPGQMSGPGMMGGPQGGPEQMGGPGMMAGPQGGPTEMGGPGQMPGPALMEGAQAAGPAKIGGPAAGGPAMAMLDAVGRLDLTDEQRAKLNAVQADLKRRQQELLEKIAAASSKLRMVSHEQALAGQSLSDLRGHLMFANMDAANRAEEMLTKEQRQALVRNSAHVMTPERPH